MIIGGTVRYEDGVKQEKGDTFSPTRKVAVELNFAVEEGQDALAYTRTVLDTAQGLANEKLGLKTATAAVVKGATVEEAKQKPKAPGRPKKVETAEVQDEIPLGNTGVQSQPLATAGTSQGAHAVTTAEDEIPLSGAAGGTSPAQSNASFSLDDLTAEPEAKEITVQEMNTAASKKMQGAKDGEMGKKILNLIRSFNPDPAKSFQAKDIPQNQRQTFLDKLDAI